MTRTEETQMPDEHSDNTYVELVEEPAFRAECKFCGWKGPLRDREQYSLAVADQMAHADHADGR